MVCKPLSLGILISSKATHLASKNDVLKLYVGVNLERLRFIPPDEIVLEKRNCNIMYPTSISTVYDCSFYGRFEVRAW